MKSIEQVEEIAKTIKKFSNVTVDNSGFAIDDGILEVTGEWNDPVITELIHKWLILNKALIISQIDSALKKDFLRAKKEYKEYLESEKARLKDLG